MDELATFLTCRRNLIWPLSVFVMTRRKDKGIACIRMAATSGNSSGASPADQYSGYGLQPATSFPNRPHTAEIGLTLRATLAHSNLVIGRAPNRTRRELQYLLSRWNELRISCAYMAEHDRASSSPDEEVWCQKQQGWTLK